MVDINNEVSKYYFTKEGIEKKIQELKDQRQHVICPLNSNTCTICCECYQDPKTESIEKMGHFQLTDTQYEMQKIRRFFYVSDRGGCRCYALHGDR